MKALFIGTGNVGATLAKRFKNIGHQVILFNREQKLPNGFAESELAKDLQTAINDAEIIVLATPFDAVTPVITDHTGWDNKIIIDATNPIASDLKSMSVGNTTSGAEQISQLAPTAKVVKTFNTTGWENMANSNYGADKLTMFLAGDDATAKATVTNIIEQLGFAPFDVGNLFLSRFLEPMAMVWIHPARLQGKGGDFGFKIISRNSN